MGSSKTLAGDSAAPIREILQAELWDRTRRNPRYSLRSFARTLNVSPSSLSRILRGERQCGPILWQRLGKQLGMSESEMVAATQVVVAGKSRLKPKALSKDQFEVLARWYHFAILELVKVKGFKPTPKWVAEELSIPRELAKQALDRLFALGYLSLSQGRVQCTAPQTTSLPAKHSTIAHRQMQKEILEMAIQALDYIPYSQRSQSSLTASMSRQTFLRVQTKIQRFRKELWDLIENDPHPEQVYQLSIAFFPVGKRRDEV